MRASIKTWAHRANHVIARHYKIAGLRGVGALCCSKLTGRPLDLLVQSHRSSRPVLLRIGTTDLSVFIQVMIECHYGIVPKTTPIYIIDAGANTGLSSLYFNHLYPNSTVIAIEPASANFIVLEKNISGCEEIIAEKSALWHKQETVQVIDPGDGAHGYRIRPSTTDRSVTTSVTSTTVPELMRRHNFPRVDILKMDIEGSEKEVFEFSSEWIGSITTIMVELHEGFKPGCTMAFETATKDFKYRYRRGETLVASRCRCTLSMT